MNHSTLAKEIYQISHLTGSFRLRSGKISNEYFDKYRFEAQPKLLKAIAKSMAPLLPVKIDALAGLEMGGIPIATALSLETGVPVVFVRKEAKSYGTCQFAEGLDVQRMNLCLVEDVITTGGQVVQSALDLRNVGATVTDVVCVINRGSESIEALTNAGLNLKSLFTKQQLDQAGLATR